MQIKVKKDLSMEGGAKDCVHGSEMKSSKLTNEWWFLIISKLKNVNNEFHYFSTYVLGVYNYFTSLYLDINFIDG